MPREKLPARRPHVTYSMFYSNREFQLGVGFYDHAETRPAEIFIDTLKSEGQMTALARDAAVLASIGLQFGASLATMWESVNKVRHEYTAGGQPPTEAAGLIGAALDALKEERPDLFSADKPAATEYMHPAPGEPSFILLGRDPQAPGLIDLWADVRERLEPESVKPGEARALAEKMRLFKDTTTLGMARKTDEAGMAMLKQIESMGVMTDEYEQLSGFYQEALRQRDAQLDTLILMEDLFRPVFPEINLRDGLDALQWTDLKTIIGNAAHLFKENQLLKKSLAEMIENNQNITDQFTALCDDHQRLKDDFDAQTAIGAQNVKTIGLLSSELADLKREKLYVELDKTIPKIFIMTGSDDDMVPEIDIVGITNRNSNPTPRLPARNARQQDGYNLCRYIWGDAAEDQRERVMRWMEEVFEFVQATPLGIKPQTIVDLMMEVYGKPVGELWQEAGGVGFTWLTVCHSFGISADNAETDEIARVIEKDPNELRRRHQIKVDRGFAMQGKRSTDEEIRHHIDLHSGGIIRGAEHFAEILRTEIPVRLSEGGLIEDFKNSFLEPGAKIYSGSIPVHVSEGGFAVILPEYSDPMQAVAIDLKTMATKTDCIPGFSDCQTTSRCARLGCGVEKGRKNKPEDTWDTATTSYDPATQG